jgi:hypothetical protein
MRRLSSLRAASSFLAVLLPLLVAATPAQAALSQEGNLFIRFDGGISPNALPRSARAPISVRLEGTIRQLGGDHPPGLRRMKVALNRAGQIEAKGLPVCRQDEIRSLSTVEALAACGSSLVGSGGYTVRTTLPNQDESVSPGEILLFNGRDRGHEAILAHAYQTEPVPVSRVFVFRITHRGGTYGTVIDAEVPPGLSRHGYLKSIYLHLGRTYAYRGKRRSYLSASCAAPAGFSRALFPFVRASMSFDDGRTLSSTISRTCRVR